MGNESLRYITDEVRRIANSTHKISSNINDEQKEKGTFSLKTDKYTNYEIVLGQITMALPGNNQKENYTNLITLNGIPFHYKVIDGTIRISFKVFDEKNNIIFEIIDGNWALKRKDYFSVNYDAEGLEMIGKTGKVIFQIYIKKEKIFINGIIGDTEVSRIIAPSTNDAILKNNPNYIEIVDQHLSEIKPIFMHHGEDYLGRRVK